MIGPPLSGNKPSNMIGPTIQMIKSYNLRLVFQLAVIKSSAMIGPTIIDKKIPYNDWSSNKR